MSFISIVGIPSSMYLDFARQLLLSSGHLANTATWSTSLPLHCTTVHLPIGLGLCTGSIRSTLLLLNHLTWTDGHLRNPRETNTDLFFSFLLLIFLSVSLSSSSCIVFSCNVVIAFAVTFLHAITTWSDIPLHNGPVSALSPHLSEREEMR